MQNVAFSKGTDISGINAFSFVIPELIKWLRTKTVSYGLTDKHEIAAGEEDLDPIIIKESNRVAGDVRLTIERKQVLFQQRSFV